MQNLRVNLPFQDVGCNIQPETCGGVILSAQVLVPCLPFPGEKLVRKLKINRIVVAIAIDPEDQQVNILC